MEQQDCRTIGMEPLITPPKPIIKKANKLKLLPNEKIKNKNCDKTQIATKHHIWQSKKAVKLKLNWKKVIKKRSQKVSIKVTPMGFSSQKVNRK